jgi:DtxR family Mn-dependent transcriptional regulator
MHTKAVEDYLKAIYEIQAKHAKVATNAIAERLDLSPASVTGMIKKLAKLNLVTHEPYQGVRLTEPGQKIALEVIRHHRLVELYLVEAMGVPWDRVHIEAEKWEHVISEDIEDRIDELLGYPTHDPHGEPIPTREGTIPETPTLRLSEIASGEAATVCRVLEPEAEMLRYLGSRGIYPGVEITVLAVEPLEGPLTVRIGDAQHVLGRNVADAITVSTAKEVV